MTNMTHSPRDSYMELVRYYRDLASQIWKVCPPILLVIGTLGNVLSILVLSRKAMRRSNAAIYLIVLALVDMIVLYTGLLRYWIIEFFHVDVRHMGEASCRIHTWLVYASLDTSVWVLVALTFERLVSVYLPHRVKKHCTMMTSVITIGVICAVMLTINSHFLYGIGRLNRKRNGTWVLIQKCAFLYPDYSHFASKIWPWIDLCIYSLIPLFIVIVSNIAIVVKVCLSRRRARRVHPTCSSFAGSNQSQDGRDKKLSSMTAMLVVLNVVLLVTTVPVSAYLIAEPYLKSTRFSPKGAAQLRVVWAVVNILQYTNNAINFLLYCISGSRFREELRAMFQRKHRVAPLTATNTHVSDVPLNRFRTLKGRKASANQTGEEEEEGPVTTSTAVPTTTFMTVTFTGGPPSASASAPSSLHPLAHVCIHNPGPPHFSFEQSPPLYTEQPATDNTSLSSNSEGKCLQWQDTDPEGMYEQQQDQNPEGMCEQQQDQNPGGKCGQQGQDPEGKCELQQDQDREGNCGVQQDQDRQGSCGVQQDQDREGNRGVQQDQDHEGNCGVQQDQDREGNRGVQQDQDHEGNCGVQQDQDREGSCGVQQDQDREGNRGVQQDQDREGNCGVQQDREGNCGVQQDQDVEGKCGQ